MNYVELYRQFFSVPPIPNASGFVKVNCCFGENHSNDDKSESAGYNVKTGVYHCSVCGSMSVFSFIKKVNGVTYSQAEEYVKSIVGEGDKEVEYSKVIPRDFTAFEDKILYDIENLSIAHSYAERTGTSIETLKELGIGYLPAKQTGWQRESLVFPYTVNGKIVGIRYRDIYGAKGGEDGSILVPWGIDSMDPSKPTVIVEGDTDRVSAVHFFKGLIDVNVVNTPTSHFSKQWARFFQDNTMPVIVIPQDDVAGEKLVDSVKAALGGRVFACKIPFNRKSLGKDLTEWFEQNDPRDIIKKFKHKLDARSSNVVVSAREFARIISESPEEEYLVTNLLYPSSVTLIAAKQKSFKTWVSLALIRSLINSEPFCGVPSFRGNAPASRILYLEAEGSERKFNERVVTSLQLTPYQDRVYIGFKTGHKLDNYESVENLLQTIIDLDINLLIIDPLQRFSKITEDSASENADLWDNINLLLNGKPGLSIVILMHFHKNGKASDKWDAIRGTSRHGGEADLGIFLERVDKDTVKMVIDGREYSSEQETFYAKLVDGVFKYMGEDNNHTEEDLKVYENVVLMAYELLKNGSPAIEVTKFCKTHNIKPKFLKLYIDEHEHLMFVEGGGRGQKATIQLKPSE